MNLKLILEKTPKKKITLISYETPDLVSKEAEVIAPSFPAFKSNLSVFSFEAQEWALDLAKTKRLKEGETRVFTFIKGETKEIAPEAPPETLKYLGIVTSGEVNKAIIMEYHGHNGTTVTLGEKEYLKNSLINLDGSPYQIVAEGVAKAVDSEAPYSHVAYFPLTEETNFAYNLINARVEPNERKEGDLGIHKGVSGIWSKLNYIFLGNSKIVIEDFAYPVFRPFEAKEALCQHGSITIPFFEEEVPSLSLTGVEAVKSFLKVPSYLSVVLPIKETSYYFTVIKGNPLRVLVFNFNQPNVNDSKELCKAFNIKPEVLKVNSLQEAMVVILKLTTGGHSVDIDSKFLLEIFKGGA